MTLVFIFVLIASFSDEFGQFTGSVACFTVSCVIMVGTAAILVFFYKLTSTVIWGSTLLAINSLAFAFVVSGLNVWVEPLYLITIVSTLLLDYLTLLPLVLIEADVWPAIGIACAAVTFI